MGGNTALSRWELVGNPRYVQGYISGFAHPSIIAEIGMGAALSAATAEIVERALMEQFPRFKSADVSHVDPHGPVYGPIRFLAWMQALRRVADMPIDVQGRVFAASAARMRVAIPCEVIIKEHQKELIKALIALVDAAIRRESLSSKLSQLSALTVQLSEDGLSSGNSVAFFREAVKKGIPVRELPGGVVQFGNGSASHRMAGSFSDETSVVATRLARDKRLAAQLLAQSGVPVPIHRTAESAEQATAFAEALGYPVVVKPADLDGGKGVAARLQTADEVRAAFSQCRALSENVIVEKFVEGRDYRVPVVRYKALWALERVPGGVTGNGVDSIGALIEALNARPERAIGPLHKLQFDDEARELIRKRGLDVESILPDGETLNLRSAANISSGGTPVPAFANAHPDNLAIAERAAKALRLNIAGIDLILPDIARSWRETGGVICEVNAAPNLERSNPAHIYGQILDILVPRSGRIPVVLIAGATDPEVVAQEVCATFSKSGLTVGCHTPHGIRIGDEVVAKGQIMSAVAGNLLALDATVDAMVLCLNDVSSEATGLPVDRFDVLLLGGGNVSGGQGLDSLLHAILPACTGAVIPFGEGADVPARPLNGGASWTDPVNVDDLASVLPAILRKQRG